MTPHKFEVWWPTDAVAYSTDSAEDAKRYGAFLCALNRVQVDATGGFIAVYERNPDGEFGNHQHGWFSEYYVCGDPQCEAEYGEGLRPRSMCEALDRMKFSQLSQWLRDNRDSYVLNYRQKPLVFEALPLPIRFNNYADEAIMVLKFAGNLC